jgi:hypothetical protein
LARGPESLWRPGQHCRFYTSHGIFSEYCLFYSPFFFFFFFFNLSDLFNVIIGDSYSAALFDPDWVKPPECPDDGLPYCQLLGDCT